MKHGFTKKDERSDRKKSYIAINKKGGVRLKPVKLDLPYPPIGCIGCDLQSARIIFPAYASAHSELTAILQYIYHSFRFGCECDKDTADLLTGIALTETHHFELLGEMLIRLGVDPVYTTSLPSTPFNFYSTGAVSYSKSVRKMLMDDLSGEIYAAESYGKMLCRLCNEEVAAVIARIKMDEELHVQVLKERMNALFCGC